MVLPPILNHVSLHCTFFRTKRTYGGIDQALQFWMAKMRFQPPTIQLGKLKVRLLNHLERLIELGTARVFLPLCLVGEFGHISNGFEAALAWIRHRTLHFPNQILNHNIYEDFLELYYWHTSWSLNRSNSNKVFFMKSQCLNRPNLTDWWLAEAIVFFKWCVIQF